MDEDIVYEGNYDFDEEGQSVLSVTGSYVEKQKILSCCMSKFYKSTG